jgi:hypothetical protein
MDYCAAEKTTSTAETRTAIHPSLLSGSAVKHSSSWRRLSFVQEIGELLRVRDGELAGVVAADVGRR